MPASIDSKPLTQTLSPLDATLMKKGGWGRRPAMGAESMTNAAPDNSHSDCQLPFGGKTIFQNNGAGERNSTGMSDPS